MILVGDIGGTNARFAIAIEASGKRIIISDYEKFKSRDYDVFEDLLQGFIKSIDHKPSKAILAVAGPVNDQKAEFTNQNWQVNSRIIEKTCKIPKVHLINDFEAMARSVPEISKENFIEINKGVAEQNAPILVAGPGTGFGACLLIKQGANWTPYATEGGHSIYAPQTDLEKEIVSHIGRDGTPVSVERLCAGKGLKDLTKAICEIKGVPYKDISPHELVERSHAGEEPFLTVSLVRANMIMSSLANMALVTGARGGVVISGGVSKHLANFLTSEEAKARFNSVWAHKDYLPNIPIKLLIDSTAPLIGAAAYGFYESAHNE